MPLDLTLKVKTSVPIEVEGIVPDALRDLPRDQMLQSPVFIGNQKLPLGDVFDAEGDATDSHFRWHGDLSGVHWIGAKMTDGIIDVMGNAGRHVGSEMQGGEIRVNGDAGDWVGGEMHGGLIHVHGHAGHLVGAAYRGSPKGMTGGTFCVDGDVGNELGHTMRRGLVAIGGGCGDLVGFNMLAGTILVFGNCGIRHGAGMRRGTIGLFGPERPELLLTFSRACAYDPLTLKLTFRHLEEHGFDVPSRLHDSIFDLYHGDLLEGGRGEIVLATAS